MSDLTKRLRDREPCYPMRSLEIEAADRIEQLEAALRDVVVLHAINLSVARGNKLTGEQFALLKGSDAAWDKARALIGEAK